MPDIGYDTAGMRAGSAGHQDTADAAEEAATAYSRIVVDPAVFGRVPSAAGLSGALDAARQYQGRSSAAEAVLRTDLAQRVRSAAEQGDGLTVDTTRIAADVPAPGGILDGMQG